VIVAIGTEAKEKIGRTPENLIACHPIRDGVVADLDITETMLRYFIERARGRFDFSKPLVVISLPHGVTDIEKKAVLMAGRAAGAREVLLIDEPMAAAVGADLPVQDPKGNMVIDIGGGTTEIAIISLFGVVTCETVRAGGHAFDQAIVNAVRREHNLMIGLPTAERLKIAVGSALPGDKKTTAKIRGMDHMTNLPREIEASSAEVHDAISDILNQIFEAGRRAIERTPPDLVEDIAHEGVVVAGGGALIAHLDERLAAELGIPVRIANEPLQTIAQGGERIIGDPGLLERVMLQ
jgi:rod shape-determining protein MreB